MRPALRCWRARSRDEEGVRERNPARAPDAGDIDQVRQPLPARPCCESAKAREGFASEASEQEAEGPRVASAVPRPCTVCRHDEHHAVNVALVHREPYRHIAKRFGVSTAALQRHSSEHIPELLLQAKHATEIADADDLLAKIQDLYQEAMAVLEAGKDGADHRLVLSAIDRAGKQLEILAEMRGALDRRPQVNFILTEEWVRIRTTLVTALEPFPEARVAVASRLLELEEGNGSGG
jgi:hypothetical protein